MKTLSKKIRRLAQALLAATMLCGGVTSCDNAIYDDEGDCEVTYRVRFVYDLNMKWADAFASEVKSVHLYAFDKAGTLVWQNTEKGEMLSEPGYTMTLDVPAGSYTLLAWCGLENDGSRPETFTVPEARVGITNIEDLKCTLRREQTAEGAFTDEKLYPLYHGMYDVTLPDMSDTGGEYTCTVPLTKDTNHIRVILQNMSGEPVDPEDFTFRIEDANGLMGYNNELISDEVIHYGAYHIGSGTAGMGLDDYPQLNGGRAMASGRSADPSRAITQVNVAIADLAIARMMADRRTILTITNPEGEIAARIPLTDYALLLKDGYDRPMTDQEFLDRQDEWNLTFFLGDDAKWIGVSIIINSWRLVIEDVNFGK